VGFADMRAKFLPTVMALWLQRTMKTVAAFGFYFSLTTDHYSDENQAQEADKHGFGTQQSLSWITDLVKIIKGFTAILILGFRSKAAVVPR
jgi:hypothetical protein